MLDLCQSDVGVHTFTFNLRLIQPSCYLLSLYRFSNKDAWESNWGINDPLVHSPRMRPSFFGNVPEADKLIVFD